LSSLRYALTPVADAHLCCGSAGSHAVFEPGTAARLGERKVAAMTAGAPDLIVTANIGCQLHLGALAPVPVRHWLEVLAEDLRPV
jgi:glycolate oxidase iron-sulfur subunit